VVREVDEEATESDEELREQRRQAIVPAAGAADPQTRAGKKKKKMPLMELTQTGEEEISAVEEVDYLGHTIFEGGVKEIQSGARALAAANVQTG
jgi:hypothetical protein